MANDTIDDELLSNSLRNQRKAWEIIEQTGLIDIWLSIGAEINLVGSLKTGLLMKNRDIDFHIYTDEFILAESFKAVGLLAQNARIKRVEYVNLIDTEEKCIEWHAWYEDDEEMLWQIDMIHISRDSPYVGVFEKVANRITSVLTHEARCAILSIKNEIPDDQKIMGIEVYQAVIRDGVRNYGEFIRWREKNAATGIVEWIP
ncbi:MAG: nucleotidyltransferase domain-containing protein [Chitinispirillaceae bacterium]